MGAVNAANLAQQVASRLRDEAVEWCRDRSWEVRAPVLLLLAWVLYHHWTEYIEYQNFFLGKFNFGIHEAGHLVFRPFGEFLTIAGGTILQLLAPVIAAASLWRTQRDAFGVAFCWGWLGTNWFHCATYCSDARGQLNLPLYSVGGQAFGADGVGDWSRMLGQLGLLEWDTKLAALMRLCGSASMLIGLALGAWLCWTMHRLRQAPGPAKVPAWAGRDPVRPLRAEPPAPGPQPGPPPLERPRREPGR